jgi:hypothetical protein
MIHDSWWLSLYRQSNRTQSFAFEIRKKRQDQFQGNRNDNFRVIRQCSVIVEAFPFAIPVADGKAFIIGAFDQKNGVTGWWGTRIHGPNNGVKTGQGASRNLPTND